MLWVLFTEISHAMSGSDIHQQNHLGTVGCCGAVVIVQHAPPTAIPPLLTVRLTASQDGSQRHSNSLCCCTVTLGRL